MTAQLQIQRQAWEQLLNLLSGRSWQFLPEHWPYLSKLADWHHVVPILYRELTANSAQHDFTDDQIEELHLSVIAERKHLLLLTQLQNRIHRQLEAQDVRALFFKGIAAGQWLYGSNLLRKCKDIDVIVHPDDHDRACLALYDIGCYRLIPREGLSSSGLARYRAAMKDFSLVHRPSNGLIELHWSLRPFRQAFEFDFDTVWEKRSSVMIDHQTIPVFDESTHIRYLAAHGCNSHWGRLCWLLDWINISEKSLDWTTIINDCANTREKAHLKSAFLLAQRQFAISIPEAVQSLPEPRFSKYVVLTQARSQLLGRYPLWPERQLLQLACQRDFSGGWGYLSHMIKKALAADTLRPEVQP